MSKVKSKPVKPAKPKKANELARLKKELKAAKVRELAHARILSAVLERSGFFDAGPLPNGLIPPKFQHASNPAHELLTLAVKISDQHSHCRITVTASPDGTTSVSIEPVKEYTAASECRVSKVSGTQEETSEKEQPVETEMWDQKGQSFKAYHIGAPQVSQRITNLPDDPSTLNQIATAIKQAAGSPSELQAMQDIGNRTPKPPWIEA